MSIESDVAFKGIEISPYFFSKKFCGLKNSLYICKTINNKTKKQNKMKKKQKYFAKFGEKLLPLPNKTALITIAYGHSNEPFPIITEGKNTYVICDVLLEVSN